MGRSVDRLLFCFDADSGVVGAMADSARKLLRVNGCALCAITHGLVSEKSEMRACREELGVPVDYVHRDELPEAARGVAHPLPAVVAVSGGEHHLLLDAETLARCRGSVADLRGKLSFHAARVGLHLELPDPPAAREILVPVIVLGELRALLDEHLRAIERVASKVLQPEE